MMLFPSPPKCFELWPFSVPSLSPYEVPVVLQVPRGTPRNHVNWWEKGESNAESDHNFYSLLLSWPPQFYTYTTRSLSKGCALVNKVNVEEKN